MRFILVPALLAFLFFVHLTSSFDRQKDCKCRAMSTKKIINGNESSNSYPWLLSLQKYSKNMSFEFLKRLSLPVDAKRLPHAYGAVLINDLWAITAGHCIVSNGSLPSDQSPQIKLGYGGNDLVSIFDENRYLEVEKVIPHPDLRKCILARTWFLYNDIALLKLRAPVAFNRNLQPACLPTKHNANYGSLTIAGWGSATPVNGSLRRGVDDSLGSRMLQEGDTKDVTSSSILCDGLQIEQICVDDPLRSACNGDSGSPIHHHSAGNTTVVGLSSWVLAKFSDTSNYTLCNGPSAYTRLFTYMQWIKSYVGEDYCSKEAD